MMSSRSSKRAIGTGRGVAAMALIDALGIKPLKIPELDGQRGLLIFPK
jgi:hypothetical protein